MSPRVRFEPIGEEIECAPQETILDAAFRQGYNLVYGCREGQCSACKCFLLEGEAELKRYSNFALSDTERSNGYSLMCRAMPEQDLVVELLHYDPDSYRLDHPIRDGRAVVDALRPLTHDITRVLLRVIEPSDFAFTPGQYVDLWVPGDAAARRSFSLANLPGDGCIELMIKRYPGGRLSGMLEGQIRPGDEIAFTGPYGSFRLRAGAAPILMIAGGSGLAPILSVLGALAEQGCERPVRFFYGARTEQDLFHLEEIAALGSRLGDFRFAPIVGRFVHEAVDEFLAEGELPGPDVYMCGPPAMLEAAEEVLIAKHRLPEQRIFQDKFTTSAEAMTGEAPGAPVEELASIPSSPGVEASEREFTWFKPGKRRPTLYEDVTVDTQPSVHRHLRRGWPVSFEDGRGTWDDRSTALASSDWFEFRDPGELWERPFYQFGNASEQQIEGAMRTAVGQGVLEDFSPEWRTFLRDLVQIPAYVEHGLWFATATIARDCLSDSVAHCVCLQAAMKQRAAQSLVLYAMDLEEHLGEFPIDAARQAFLTDPEWQPTRRYLERLAATHDWGEVLIAANLCFEPVVGTLLRRELGTRAAAANGDTLSPTLARVETQEWEWVRSWSTELCRFLLNDSRHGEANRRTISTWVCDWLPRALEAAAALTPLAERIPVGIDIAQSLGWISRYAASLLSDAGLGELASPLGLDSAPGPRAPGGGKPGSAGPPRRVRTGPARRSRVGETALTPDVSDAHPKDPPLPAESPAGEYDFVGIVMAKSAEGDAVASILGQRPEIEVIEQPAFWDIRAADRLIIRYDEVSDQLGYGIDAYSIQHEMSTHYGRMVASDDALMLFSDPAEAMQYLMT
ncbi:MAG: MmoB/DmpM family protein [Solirubrobacteraceae bacterium]